LLYFYLNIQTMLDIYSTSIEIFTIFQSSYMLQLFRNLKLNNKEN
jgi:hypothetical protein